MSAYKLDIEWLETCAQAGEFLYGAYPVQILKQLYETRKGYTISEKTVVEAMQDSQNHLMEYDPDNYEEFEELGYPDGCFVPVFAEEDTPLFDMLKKAENDGNPYASIHFEEEELFDLLDQQMDKPFYIPKEKEILQLTQKGYITDGSMIVLEKAFADLGKDLTFLHSFWPQYSAGKLDTMDGVQTICKVFLEGINASFDEINREKMPLINDFLGNINLRSNRGWRPKALHQRMGGFKGPITITPGSAKMAETMQELEPKLREMGILTDYSSIRNIPVTGAHGETKMIKVGRNDPCPCGSGKKFKQCHGK